MIIPVYNEVKAIENLVNNLNIEILQYNPNVFIHVFEDGSSDGTKNVLKKMLSSGEIPQFIPNMTYERKGYPKAVLDAISFIDPAQYSYILFMDGDGQYPMDDIKKVLNYNLLNAHDMVVGCRVERVEPGWRKILTWGVRTLESILFDLDIKDVTSALRLMRTETAQKISSDVKYSKYNFWLEFTARMSVLNLNVLEIPVGYIQRDEGESQVYSLKKIPKILWAEIRAVFMTFFELNYKTIVKFALVGGIGAITILVFTLLFTEYFHLWYILSAAIGIEISIILAFILNTKLTFRHKFNNVKKTIKSLITYHGTALGGMMINLMILYILTQYAQLYYLFSEVIGIIFAFGFNYLASSRYVWNKSVKERN